MPDTPTPTQLLEVAMQAARAAGAHALAHYARRREADQVLDHDIKLVLDRECQEVAETVIHGAFDGHAILGEEGSSSVEHAPVEWIIDPIDGTVNYSSGLPHWCHCVAARAGNRILAGAVYAPRLDEMFSASVDTPARCNGEVLQPAETPSLRQAMVLCSMPGWAEADDPVRKMIYDVNRAAYKIRVHGSAALDACYVASGRADVYFETTIHLWDVAAAGIVAERAGLQTFLRRVGDPERVHFVCATPAVMPEIMRIYHRYFP